jgi:hypothetical protein
LVGSRDSSVDEGGMRGHWYEGDVAPIPLL